MQIKIPGLTKIIEKIEQITKKIDEVLSIVKILK